MKNSEIETLNKTLNVMQELKNQNKLSVEQNEILNEFAELVAQIIADKEKSREMTRRYIAERRKTDKNYARPKNTK